MVKKSDVESNLLEKLMAEKKASGKDIVKEEKKVKEVAIETKKIKVNDAAGELGMTVEDFMVKLASIGHKVKSSTSNIEYDVYQKIKESIA